MYDKGTVLIHGNSEVCRIDDIRYEKFGKDRIKYYILKPVYDSRATIYCPVDKEEERLRPLITKEQADEMISAIPESDSEWIKDDRQRKERFSEIIRDGSHAELAEMIKSIYSNRFAAEKPGRRMHMADERAMKEAEKILYDELGYVLEIEPETVPDYIGKKLAEAIG